MNELLKSMFSLSLAAVLMSTKLASRSRGGSKEGEEVKTASQELHSVADFAVRDMGDGWRDTYRMGDRMMRECIDITTSITRLDGFNPMSIMRRMGGTFRSATRSDDHE